MTASHPKRRVYKDSTAQQLRSFWETARLGSLSAAAASLGLSPTTVWQQVRDLERVFGESLLETHRRGARLTDAGRVLADLAGPIVENLTSLTRRFREARGQQRGRLIVAATPHIVVEDMPECIDEFRRRRPDDLLTLKELSNEGVHAAVAGGEVDLGLVIGHAQDLVTPWKESPWIEFEPLYDLEVLLLTPRDHPLARRRHIRPSDLAGYSWVNAPNQISDPVTLAVLDEEGVQSAGHGIVEAFFNATVRRYVALGYGIGLIPALPSRVPDPGVHERPMSRYFGRPRVHRLKRKGVPLSPQAVLFEHVVRQKFGETRKGAPTARERSGHAGAEDSRIEPAKLREPSRGGPKQNGGPSRRG